MTHRGMGPLAPEAIYDALCDDEAFAALPAALAAAVGARSATLCWRHTDGTAEIMAHSGYFTDAHFEDYTAHYADHDLWVLSALPEARRNRVWNLDELVSSNRYLNSRFFNDWIKGMGDDTFHCLGISTVTRDGAGIIGLHRGRGGERFDGDEVDVLSAMMPALRRMLAMRGRLQSARRAQGEADALLDVVSLCVVVVSPDGRLAYANKSGEALLAAPQALQLKAARVVAAGTAEPQLRAAIALATHRTAPAGSTVVLVCGSIVTVSPHRAAGGARQALLVASPSSYPATAEMMLHSTFGLSTAEAAIAMLLARGLDLRAIADRRGTTYATVRTQLSSIAAKMDCARQSQIAAVVTRMALQS